jgi:hypothetical protein
MYDHLPLRATKDTLENIKNTEFAVCMATKLLSQIPPKPPPHLSSPQFLNPERNKVITAKADSHAMARTPAERNIHNPLDTGPR